MNPVPQALVSADPPAAGLCLRWRLSGDASEALGLLRDLKLGTSIIGVGKPLADVLGVEIAGLSSFSRRYASYGMPATQEALWAFVATRDISSAIDEADRIRDHLSGCFELVESSSLFRYLDGRDLSGFHDGIANPDPAEALKCAIVPNGPLAGSSFVIVQRYIYFRDRLLSLSVADRDAIIGRNSSTDEELADAGRSAHIRRTDQDDLGGRMFRRSMPWGDARRQGLMFIGFLNDIALAERMLDRMTGAADGIADDVLHVSQAETGGYYFCPPAKDGKMDFTFMETGAQVDRAPDATVEVKNGNGIQLRFEASRCIHSRNCVLSRPDVFVPNVVGEWLHPELASAAQLKELAHNCPSGAIRYAEAQDGSVEEAPVVNTVRVRENGPLALHAEATLKGRGGLLRAVLCRCGQSKNKPFCDNSHSRVGFKASGEPETRNDKPLDRRAGPVFVSPTPDGPLAIDGPLEIVSGTGRTVARTQHATLCRCGHSESKPFCDGSHAKSEFRSNPH